LRLALQQKNKQQELLANLQRVLNDKRITPREYELKVREYQAKLAVTVERIAFVKKNVSAGIDVEKHRINRIRTQFEENNTDLNLGRVSQEQYQKNNKLIQDYLSVSKTRLEELEKLANAKDPRDIPPQIAADRISKTAGSRKVMNGALIGTIGVCLIIGLTVWIGVGRGPSEPASSSSPPAITTAVSPTPQTLPSTQTPIATPPTTPTPAITPPPTSQSPISFADAASSAKQSIVLIMAKMSNGDIATGSGVVVASKGVILTNKHVVQGAISMLIFSPHDGKVVLDQRTGIEARLIKYHSVADLALIETTRISGLVPAALGDATAVRDGESVAALGFPAIDYFYSMSGSTISATITSGIVSSHIRFKDGVDYLQIDAPVNPGNSGGGLINQKGEVIGIPTFKLQPDGKPAEGLNFAISMSYAKSFVQSNVS
jgi:S1-C subfamily serine protease